MRNFNLTESDSKMYDHVMISEILMQIDDYNSSVMSIIQHFNITFKAIVEYSCIQIFNKVNLNVTFAWTSQSNLKETSLLSINIADFDNQSILSTINLSMYSDNNNTMNHSYECIFFSNLTCKAVTSSILSCLNV